METKEYRVMVGLRHGFGFDILVREENAELALNKVQGMLYSEDGWTQLDSANGDKHRVRAGEVTHLAIDSQLQ